MARKTRRAAAEYPLECPPIDHLPRLDMRAVARLSRFPISTLQMQLQREVYPWLKVRQQGRARRFDPAFALHLSIVGKLTIGFGVPAATASVLALDIIQLARTHLTEPDLHAVIGPTPEPPLGQIISPLPRPVWVVQTKTMSEIENTLGDQLPDSFIVLDIAEMVRRVVEAAKAAAEIELLGMQRRSLAKNDAFLLPGRGKPTERKRKSRNENHLPYHHGNFHKVSRTRSK